MEALIHGDVNGTNISVELCGGTHVHNVQELQDFVILADESIARGVRRIIVATGQEALKARAYAKDLEHRLQALRSSSSTLDNDCTAQLHTYKVELQQKKDQLPLTARKRCTELLETLTRQQMTLAKEKGKLLKKAAEQLGLSLGEQYKDASYCVHTTGRTFSGDFKALETAVSQFHKLTPTTSILLLSQSATGVVALASVPKTGASSLNASHWVSSTLVPLGGKGGGKPDTARGSATVSNTEQGELNAAAFAEEYATKLVPTPTAPASKLTDN